MLKESDVVLTQWAFWAAARGSSLGMEGQGILDELAGVSGGKAFYPRSPAEMDDIFEQIALELRHQYSIGYRPKNFVNDGKWHKIKVKVNAPRGLPRLFVRSREGYYAIANPNKVSEARAVSEGHVALPDGRVRTQPTQTAISLLTFSSCSRKRFDIGLF